ncbi:MAG: KH domain-containing protein [Actinomycetota bacterium]
MKELVEFLCMELVDDPDAVSVSESFDDRGSVYQVRVADGELGKLIGRGGRTAKAIRTVVRAAASRQQLSTRVDFED